MLVIGGMNGNQQVVTPVAIPVVASVKRISSANIELIQRFPVLGRHATEPGARQDQPVIHALTPKTPIIMGWL